MGCPGWGYEDVLPYFRKAEDNDTWDNRYHGKGGPLGVSAARAPLPICEAWFAAAAEMGIPRNPDITGETQDGVGYYQLTQKHVRRSSTATAYLKPGTGPPKPDRQDRRPGPPDRGGKRPRHRGGDPRRHRCAPPPRSSCHPAPSARPGSAALGHRPGGSPGRPWHPRGAGPARRSARTCRTTSTCSSSPNARGPFTYDRYAKPHWSALAGLQYLLMRKGPVASSLFETGGFWYADPDARSPDIQFHLGLGSGIEAGVAAMPQGGVTLNSAYPAAALARDGPAGQRRPAGRPADRPELLGRPA
jgi:choline dehydrogenase